MISRRRFLECTALTTLALALKPKPALAAPHVIIALPSTISSAGTYILSSDIDVDLEDGAAINIVADDVTLDLTNRIIRNQNNRSTTAVGVYGTNVSRATIIGGRLSGFHTGVMLSSANPVFGGHRIQSVHSEDNYAMGIMVGASACFLEGNQVESSTRSSANVSDLCTAAMGIAVFAPQGAILKDNSVNLQQVTYPDDFCVGIYVAPGSREVAALGNTISYVSAGIVCDSNTVAEFRDNITSNVNFDYIGGFELGNNS